MRICELTMDTNILSLSTLLGTNGQQELINDINARGGGGSYFGSVNDPFREGFTNFMNQIVIPIRNVRNAMKHTFDAMMMKDVFRPIDSIEKLEMGIPPCMYYPIIYTPVIRQLLYEERIDGFGIDIQTLREDDPYQVLLDNGHVELHSTTLEKDGKYTIRFCEDTSAPELTFEEVDALRATREFINRFYQEESTRVLDFTSYPDLRC